MTHHRHGKRSRNTRSKRIARRGYVRYVYYDASGRKVKRWWD